MIKPLRLRFSHDFKAEFGKKFGQDSEFEVRSKILKLKSTKLNFGEDTEAEF